MEPVFAFQDPPGPDHDIVPADRREPPPAVRLVARSTHSRADLAIHHRQRISTLLAHRDDLRGVHAFADVVEESVRWSA